MRPYYVKTPFQPRFELDDALRLTKELGTELTVIEYDILNDGLVAANPADRCYHCKKKLFGLLLRERAANDGFSLIIDGTNASDDAGDRPGMRALGELCVRSPLRECGLTKAEIRARSKEAGLFTWNKPAYACLATRVPTGRPIERELFSAWRGRRANCSPSASQTSACASFTRQRVSSSPPLRWRRRWKGAGYSLRG